MKVLFSTIVTATLASVSAVQAQDQDHMYRGAPGLYAPGLDPNMFGGSVPRPSLDRPYDPVPAAPSYVPPPEPYSQPYSRPYSQPSYGSRSYGSPSYSTSPGDDD
jgi:hypothetical protein